MPGQRTLLRSAVAVVLGMAVLGAALAVLGLIEPSTALGMPCGAAVTVGLAVLVLMRAGRRGTPLPGGRAAEERRRRLDDAALDRLEPLDGAER